MRYPNILFFRYEYYANMIDPYLKDHTNEFYCTFHTISNPMDLRKMFSCNFPLLVTYGNKTKNEYMSDIEEFLPERIYNTNWLHFSTMDNPTEISDQINKHYMNFAIQPKRPKFSIFTTTFESYEKIHRCYQSICAQSYKDWEWIILDDSPTDAHFQFLREHFLEDPRIRLYRRSQNSGSIGDVKNEAVALCRGEYLLEMDHDDQIMPDVLKDSVTVFERDSMVGFIYMDFMNIYEDGSPFFYQSECISLGYSAYYFQKIHGIWQYVFITANINNQTLSHIVSVPNHPRIWRKDVLLKIGNYSEFLPICDDYELLLRTAIHTKMVKIPKMGYIQYMNRHDNNFSLIRNSEINRLCPQYIKPACYKKYDIENYMKSLGAYDDYREHIPLWRRDSKYQYHYCNEIVNLDYDRQICILGLETLRKNLPNIRKLYDENPRIDFIVLDTQPEITIQLDDLKLDRMKCYTFPVGTTIEQQKQYFLRMYKSCIAYEFMEGSYIKYSLDFINSHKGNIAQKWESLQYHTEFPTRAAVINHNTNPTTDRYLEIGIEYGDTFQKVHFEDKVGVDPDPKFICDDIIRTTSDDFFKTNTRFFDVIFIDGMHQVEYMIRDFNHAVCVLQPNGGGGNRYGVLFIDDILPYTEREQYKIPEKHYYENGILKYGEPWTGDIWKVMYYLLQNYRDKFEFSYYNHRNYRGIAKIIPREIIQIPESCIDSINGYSYRGGDFANYLHLLCH